MRGLTSSPTVSTACRAGLNGWLAVWRVVIAAGGRAGRAAGAPQIPAPAVAALALCVLCYAGEWRINR
ncbi:MAG: hypothetical protein ACLUFT_09915 [Gemmiger formicilis]|uniref:hypothetical protein n=1 Tax=Gemmiger formicilis TaxID=745368 RepID=UPI0039910C65